MSELNLPAKRHSRSLSEVEARRQRRSTFTPVRVWVGFFCLWLILLSGIFRQAPGILQAIRTRSLLAERQLRLKTSESDLEKLKAQRDRFLKDPRVQEEEIRETLGYVRDQEMVFDFTSRGQKIDPNL